MKLTIELRAVHAVVVGAVALAAVGGYVAGARAGAPPQDTLFFAGVIDEDGALVDATRDISVAFFDSPTAGAGTLVCATPTNNDAPVSGGRFRIDIASCSSAIRAVQQPLFAEVTVDGEALPRVQVGAVPFALEADRAQNAGIADTANTANTANSANSANSVADNSIDSDAIAIAAVTTEELADGAVNIDKILADSVDGARIVDGTVTQDDAPFAPIIATSIGGGGVQVRNDFRVAHFAGNVNFPVTVSSQQESVDFAGAGFTDPDNVECLAYANDGLSNVVQPSRVVYVPATATVDVTFDRQDDANADVPAGSVVRVQIFCIGR